MKLKESTTDRTGCNGAAFITDLGFLINTFPCRLSFVLSNALLTVVGAHVLVTKWRGLVKIDFSYMIK